MAVAILTTRCRLLGELFSGHVENNEFGSLCVCRRNSKLRLGMKDLKWCLGSVPGVRSVPKRTPWALSVELW